MAKFRVAKLSRELPVSNLSSSDTLTRWCNWLRLLVVVLIGKAADRATALGNPDGDSDHVTKLAQLNPPTHVTCSHV